MDVENRAMLLDTPRKLSAFLGQTSCASARVLLLDYDGTLAQFCSEASQAKPYPAVARLLQRIRNTTNTRLVIVTGRRAYDAARLLDLKHVEVWGCHGLERLHADGTYEMPNIPSPALRTIWEADDLLVSQGLADLMERKPAGTAIHWRGREAVAGEARQKVLKAWSMLGQKDGLCLADFDGGIEIRLAIVNKGRAVRTILNELGGGAAIAYLGDDQTDEDAFLALKGHGLSVLVRSEYRPTAADAWIRPPDGVVTFLADWCTACRGAA